MVVVVADSHLGLEGRARQASVALNLTLALGLPPTLVDPPPTLVDPPQTLVDRPQTLVVSPATGSPTASLTGNSYLSYFQNWAGCWSVSWPVNICKPFRTDR